jgi:hypothetical protein
MVLADGASPFHRRSSVDRLEEAFQMRDGAERVTGALAHAGRTIEPAPGRHVRNHEAIAGDEGPPLQMVVQHLVVTLGFPAVPVRGVIQALRCRELEMHGLAGVGAQARGDKQQPGEQLRPVLGFARNLSVFSAR